MGDAPRSGRPHATSEYADARIVHASEIDPFLSNELIRQGLQLDVSEDTVGRRLDAAGLGSHIAARKRHYTEDEKRKRLSFAHGYEHRSLEDWEHTIMCDEKEFKGVGSRKYQRVRRPRGTRYEPEYTVHSQTWPPGVHWFVCWCARGPGYAMQYHGTLDGPALKKLLNDCILPTAKDYFDVEHAEPWWLLHDNSPQFKSNVVQKWIHDHGIQRIDFPPNSPDLEPTENLFAILQRAVHKRHPVSAQAMADAFVNAYNNLDLDIYPELAFSMPERIKAVIDANGNATKF